MTQEQYDRAVEIIKRTNELEDTKNKINDPEVRLNYVRTLRPTGYTIQAIHGQISDIIDRHDKMIREEIDAEIEKLKKEIEEL